MDRIKDKIERWLIDNHEGTSLWWLGPLGLALYLIFNTLFLRETIASVFLLVMIASGLSGKAAGFFTASTASLYAIWILGPGWRSVEVAFSFLCVPVIMHIARWLAHRAQEKLEELDDSLKKLRLALAELDKVLSNDLLPDVSAPLFRVRGRIADLLTVAGMWKAYTRQRQKDIKQWSEE